MAQQISSPPESWCRIDAWPATHAASDFALLDPPATRDDTRRAGQLLGIPLPGDLAESLQCHDGVSVWAAFLPEQSPLTVSGIVDRWQTCMDVAVENDGLTRRPWDDEPWWHALWIPWAESADGGVQVTDQRPVRIRAASAGQATAVAVTPPIPGLILQAFSTQSRMRFMKAVTCAGCTPGLDPGSWTHETLGPEDLRTDISWS